MGENLKTSKYSDGTPIPNVTDKTEWSKLTTGAWGNYNNNETLGDIHGKLYNWFTVSQSINSNKNVCPTGWHVPSNNEWNILTDYLGGYAIAGGKLKEVGYTNWNNPNTDATNITLFSALPSGNLSHDGYYGYIGSYGFWWSSSDKVSDAAWGSHMYSNSGDVGYDGYNKNAGFSIRCLKNGDNTTNQPTQGSIQNIDCGAVANTGVLLDATPASNVSSILTYTGGNGGAYSGQTILSTTVTGLKATLISGTFSNGNGNLTFTITGTPSSSGDAIFSINIGGKSCVLTRSVKINTLIGSYAQNLSDIDGNTYKTVKIGSQIWMAENLKTAKYNDGSYISNVTDNNLWGNLSSGAWCYYNNSDSLGKIYGKMYNWYVVSAFSSENKNVCPVGWHVPSNSDWTILSDFLGGTTNNLTSKIKEYGVSHWNSPNVDATNTSLFTALPGGYYYNWGDYSGNKYTFYGLGAECGWWSNQENWIFNIGNAILENGGSANKNAGRSIRCLKD